MAHDFRNQDSESQSEWLGKSGVREKRINILKDKINDWYDDTLDKYDKERPDTYRKIEYAQTLDTLGIILDMINDIK